MNASMPRPNESGGSCAGHLVDAVEAVRAHLLSAIEAGVRVLAPEPRALEHIELLRSDPIVKGAPEVGGHPDIHFEIEVALLPGGDGLLLHIVVSRLAMERQSVSQLVHDSHRFFGIDTLVHQHGRR